MGRTYKTGPARSRRRPDPSTVYSQFAQVMLLSDQGSNAGTGSLELIIQIIDPSTGIPAVAQLFEQSGQTSRGYVIDQAGTIHPLVIGDVVDGNSIEYVPLTGMATGPAQAIIPFGDLSVTNPNGARIGTFHKQFDLT